MSRKYKIKNQNYPHFVSFAVVHWIDLSIRPKYSHILLESLTYCQNQKRLIIYSWCIMPSHMHLIMGTSNEPMEGILRDFKGFTSRKLKNVIKNNTQESRKEWIMWMMKRAGKRNNNNNNWQLWQQHNHPIELSENEMIEQPMNYLHENPVKAGFVDYPQDWLYSSARDYCGRKGLLNICTAEY